MFARVRNWRLPLVIAAAVSLAACDDTSAPETEPEIATMRITVGIGTAQVVNVAENCTASGSITIAINTTTALSVSFLNAAGQPDAIANNATIFRLAGDADVAGGPEPAPTPTTIVWARTGPFAGTLRGSAVTSSGSVKLSAYHIEEGHADFGCAVPIVVTP